MNRTDLFWPNIVLITIDSLRRDRLGCYGYRKNISPNIDRLSETSFVFLNAFSSGPNTPHSFMGIMASQHPFSSRELSIRHCQSTLAEILLENGYWTQGFNAGNPWVSQYYGYDKGFSELVDFLELQSTNDPGFKFVLNKKSGESVEIRRVPYFKEIPLRGMLRRCLPQVVRRDARRFIQGLRNFFSYMDHIKVKLEIEKPFTRSLIQWIMRNDKEPFLLWTHFMTVHEPYAPAMIDQLRVNKKILWKYKVNRLRRETEHRLQNNTITTSYVNQLSSLYDAEIRRVDRWVGKILRALRRKGVYDRSCVILCSDHGEEFFEHGGLFHSAKLNDELLRVPLLIHLPGQKLKQVASRRVGLIDLLPTIAGYLGIVFDSNSYEGDSFAEMLVGAPVRGEDGRILAAEAFYDQNEIIIGFNPYDTCCVARRLCLYNGNMKFIADCTQEKLEIYNMEKDPLETNDLSKTHPELKRLAKALIREHLRNNERKRLSMAMRKHPRLNPKLCL